MKKLVPAVLSSVVLLGLTQPVFADDESGEEKKIVIWVNRDKSHDGLVTIGKKFEKDTGVKVLVAYPDDMVNRFIEFSSSGTGPDVLLWAHDRFGELVSKGTIDPVVPTIDEYKKFDKLAWAAMKVNGQYYGYPLSIESVSLMCNKDIVDKAPASFEEIMKLDEKLRKTGKKAIMWNYKIPYFTFPLLSANGGYSFKRNEDGSYDVKDTGINNEGSRIGMRFLVKMIISGVMPKGATYQQTEESFANGEVACILDGAWTWNKYKKIKLSVNMLPTLNGKIARPMVGVPGFAINSSSMNKDIAKKFLTEYVLTDEGLEIMNNDRPLGPVALISYEKKQEKDPRIAISMKNAINGELMPSVFEMSRYWRTLGNAISNSVTGRMSVDDALAEAEKGVVY